MKCKYCGKEIDEGSIFCGFCGKKQPSVRHCIKCGQEIDYEDVFCGYCGSPQDVKDPPKGVLTDEQEALQASQTDLRQETDIVAPSKNTDDNSQVEKVFQEGAGVEENKPKNSITYAIIACLALFVCCLGGYVLSNIISSNKSSDYQNIEQAESIEIEETDNDTDSSGEEKIIERVNYIYNEVSKNYKELGKKVINADSLFLTTELYNLIKKDKEITPEGELGYLDYDHWIQAQDWDYLSASVQSVEIISKTKATVKIIIKIADYCDSENLELVLINERGDWYIDDFIGIGGSEKQGLIDYIKEMTRKECECYTCCDGDCKEVGAVLEPDARGDVYVCKFCYGRGMVQGGGECLPH